MFRALIKSWKSGDLLSQALKEVKKTLSDDEIMFRAAVESLTDNKKPRIDIYKMDKKINKAETDIRQKVLEHITLNPKQDVISFLILIDLVRDLERIGDFTKNIVELNNMYPAKLKGGRYASELDEVKNVVLKMFSLTKTALEGSDENAARAVMELHHKTVSLKMDKLIEDLISEKQIDVKKAVVCALFARYLKRTSAHLMNISSSVANPYHRVRNRLENNYVELLAKKMKKSN